MSADPFDRRCGFCHDRLPCDPTGQRRYCSRACRQRAYERRWDLPVGGKNQPRPPRGPGRSSDHGVPESLLALYTPDSFTLGEVRTIREAVS